MNTKMTISEITNVVGSVQVKFTNEAELVAITLSPTNELLYVVYSKRGLHYDYDDVGYLFCNQGHNFKRGKMPEHLKPYELEERAVKAANFVRG